MIRPFQLLVRRSKINGIYFQLIVHHCIFGLIISLNEERLWLAFVFYGRNLDLHVYRLWNCM